MLAGCSGAPCILTALDQNQAQLAEVCRMFIHQIIIYVQEGLLSETSMGLPIEQEVHNSSHP